MDTNMPPSLNRIDQMGFYTGQMFVHNPYQELPGDYPSPQ